MVGQNYFYVCTFVCLINFKFSTVFAHRCAFREICLPSDLYPVWETLVTIVNSFNLVIGLLRFLSPKYQSLGSSKWVIFIDLTSVTYLVTKSKTNFVWPQLEKKHLIYCPAMSLGQGRLGFAKICQTKDKQTCCSKPNCDFRLDMS